MEAIVLAGGLGTRLREVVSDVPKAMAVIAGQPFLEILLSSLEDKGFERVIISVGYMAEKISGYFGPKFGKMELIYVVEEKPLGTGGAARMAMENVVGDHTFIFNGDTFLDLEADLLEKQFLENKRPTIVGCEVEDTTRYGRLNQKDGVAVSIAEKGVSGPGLINGGCYIMSKNELSSFPLNSSFSLEREFMVDAVAAGKFNVFITNGRFIDIGTPQDYKRAEAVIKSIKT